MTTKQRAALRSMGAVMEPVLHIGKEGITPTVIKQCWDALEARELIKVQVQRNAPLRPDPRGVRRAVRKGTRRAGAGDRQPLCDLSGKRERIRAFIWKSWADQISFSGSSLAGRQISAINSSASPNRR